MYLSPASFTIRGSVITNHILIICVGNVCRSPMAAALLSKRLQADYPEITVVSAGLQALVGRPAEPVAVALLQERGIDITNHRAKQLTTTMLFDADLILTMSTRQQEQIKSTLPTICGKVHRLGHWEPYDITDPFQRPRGSFVQTLALIDKGIDSWYQHLWNNNAKNH